MLWTEVRRWAKEKGFSVTKDKENNKYFWSKTEVDGTEHTGEASSVSKLARSIYNHITDSKWVEHQNNYKNQSVMEKIQNEN